jgi:hypothetical protein
MPDHEVFDTLPRIFFKGLRERMLLGVVSSETVERILGPALEDYAAIVPRLPPRLQNDLDDILRMYPEVAEYYGLTPKPAFFAVLDSLWDLLREILAGGKPALGRGLAGAWDSGGGAGGEMALEAQKPLGRRSTARGCRTSVCLTTDGGNEVLLELSCVEGEEAVCFESSGLAGTIELHLCGCPVLNLGPGAGRQCLTLDELAERLRGRESSNMEVEIFEKED